MVNMEMMKKQTPSSALSIHRYSQTVSKSKPKIRIIHIFAPEIIKTDVANFRELVQRLTGKPTETNTKKKQRRIHIEEFPEMRKGFRSAELRDRFKGGEESMVGGENSNSSDDGFLNGFSDLDGFMKEVNEFPLCPLDSTNSHMEDSTCLASSKTVIFS